MGFLASQKPTGVLVKAEIVLKTKKDTHGCFMGLFCEIVRLHINLHPAQKDFFNFFSKRIGVFSIKK